MSGAIAGPRSEQTLEFELPPLWQRVNADLLLEGLLGAAAELESHAPLDSEEQAAVGELALSRRAQRDDRVVCVALSRRREVPAADLLTIALPEPLVPGGTPALDAPVRFGSAVGGELGIFRSHVQILAPIAGASGSAILTLMSTERAVRFELEVLGAAVAESMKLS